MMEQIWLMHRVSASGEPGGKGREGEGEGREGGREGGRERSYKEVPGCLDNYEITSLLYSHDPHRIRSLKLIT